MTYYKIIRNGEVVDAGFTFLRWDERLGRLLGCDAKDAQFVQGMDGETVYRVGWLNPAPACTAGMFETVSASLIDPQEYDDLKAVLDSGETVPEPSEEEYQPDEQPDEDGCESNEEKPMTVQQMRQKISEQEETIAMLMECLLEMSEVVYA